MLKQAIALTTAALCFTALCACSLQTTSTSEAPVPASPSTAYPQQEPSPAPDDSTVAAESPAGEPGAAEIRVEDLEPAYTFTQEEMQQLDPTALDPLEEKYMALLVSDILAAYHSGQLPIPLQEGDTRDSFFSPVPNGVALPTGPVAFSELEVGLSSEMTGGLDIGLPLEDGYTMWAHIVTHTGNEPYTIAVWDVVSRQG